METACLMVLMVFEVASALGLSVREDDLLLDVLPRAYMPSGRVQCRLTIGLVDSGFLEH